MPEFACMVVGDPLLWKCLQRLCRVTQGSAGRLEKETVVMEARAHLVTHYGNVKPARAYGRGEGIAIERAKDYLSTTLDRKVSLSATPFARILELLRGNTSPNLDGCIKKATFYNRFSWVHDTPFSRSN